MSVNNQNVDSDKSLVDELDEIYQELESKESVSDKIESDSNRNPKSYVRDGINTLTTLKKTSKLAKEQGLLPWSF